MDQCGEDKIMKKVLYLVLLPLLLLNPNLSFASNTGTIAVQVQDTNFNTVIFQEGQCYFLVYQDFSTQPFKRIDSPPTNPYTISDLPLGHQYKVEYYDHDIFGGANFINLQTGSSDMKII